MSKTDKVNNATMVAEAKTGAKPEKSFVKRVKAILNYKEKLVKPKSKYIQLVFISEGRREVQDYSSEKKAARDFNKLAKNIVLSQAKDANKAGSLSLVMEGETILNLTYNALFK